MPRVRPWPSATPTDTPPPRAAGPRRSPSTRARLRSGTPSPPRWHTVIALVRSDAIAIRAPMSPGRRTVAAMGERFRGPFRKGNRSVLSPMVSAWVRTVGSRPRSQFACEFVRLSDRSPGPPARPSAGQRRPGQALHGPLVLRQGADGAVDAERLLVPVEHRPLEADQPRSTQIAASAASSALPWPAPRACGRTYRSSRYSPGVPVQVEKLRNHRAKPTGLAGGCRRPAISAWATGSGPKSAARSCSSVARASLSARSYVGEFADQGVQDGQVGGGRGADHATRLRSGDVTGVRGARAHVTR